MDLAQEYFKVRKYFCTLMWKNLRFYKVTDQNLSSLKSSIWKKKTEKNLWKVQWRKNLIIKTLICPKKIPKKF